ncbi:MAG: hypothetical protein KDB20_14515, partial [Microthrixaceae bacterium]|nr:hypothetical protein [Microthrixaceae bacterium]
MAGSRRRGRQPQQRHRLANDRHLRPSQRRLGRRRCRHPEGADRIHRRLEPAPRPRRRRRDPRLVRRCGMAPPDRTRRGLRLRAIDRADR